MRNRTLERKRYERWNRFYNWVSDKRDKSLLRLCGGTQKCPYCLQRMGHGEDHPIKPYPENEMLDVITCGTCSGQSLWRWEIGFFYWGPLKAPEPKFESSFKQAS